MATGVFVKPGNGADRAQELEPARQRHTEVEHDGVRAVGLGQGQPFFGRQGRPHFVALQTKHVYGTWRIIDDPAPTLRNSTAASTAVWSSA